MIIKFVKSGEKKRIVRELGDRYGISKLPYTLLETGKQKIRAFSGNMTREEIMELSEIANVEIVGMYLIKRERQLRLSLDATQILQKQINKNIIEITDAEVQDWLRGKNIEKENKPGIYVIKNGDDFIGCAMSDGKKLINFVPKERRIRRN